MKKYALVLIVLLIVLVSVSSCKDLFKNTYRYSCQNPENFKNEECNPPTCEADGTCSKYLVDGSALKAPN